MGPIRPLGGDLYPWYRSHGRVALITAILLFVAVTVLYIVDIGTGQSVDIFFVLPIALLAMSFGLRGGLIGAAVGFVLFAGVQLAFGGDDISVMRWVTRGTGLFLLGILLGHATDQIEAAQRRTIADLEERQALAERARRQAEALEISDSILQHLAVAKWMIEVGNDDEAVTILTSTIATGEAMVADLLPIRTGDHSGSDSELRVSDSTG